MKKIIFLVFIFGLFTFSCFTQKYFKKYSYKEAWYASETIEGYSIYEVRIKSSLKEGKIESNRIQAELFHTITPFSQIIWTDITLELTENKKYEFSFTDPWNNKAFGWVKFDSEEIELYLDCNEFDEIGKNFARLYGETIRLHETTNDQDFLKKALKIK